MRISHHIEQGITELLLQTAKMNQGGKKRDSIFKLSNKKGKEVDEVGKEKSIVLSDTTPLFDTLGA